jgi:hypothetical protein
MAEGTKRFRLLGTVMEKSIGPRSDDSLQDGEVSGESPSDAFTFSYEERPVDVDGKSPRPPEEPRLEPPCFGFPRPPPTGFVPFVLPLPPDEPASIWETDIWNQQWSAI